MTSGACNSVFKYRFLPTPFMRAGSSRLFGEEPILLCSAPLCPVRAYGPPGQEVRRALALLMTRAWIHQGPGGSGDGLRMRTHRQAHHPDLGQARDRMEMSVNPPQSGLHRPGHAADTHTHSAEECAEQTLAGADESGHRTGQGTK